MEPMLSGESTQSAPKNQPQYDLALLPRMDPWGATFVRNLRDFLLLRDWPPISRGRRYEGWRTAYINTAPSWSHIRESWHGHLFIVIAGFALLSSPLFQKTPKLESPFQHARIEYFPLSEYLPPIHAPLPHTLTRRKADPAYAPQEIISVRPNPDNRSQTIITAPNIKLDHDVPLPNIAMGNVDPIPPPVDVSSAKPRLVFPFAPPVPVEPAVDVNRLDARKHAPDLRADAVEPTANLNSLKERQRQLRMQATAVEPIADLNSLRERQRQMKSLGSAVEPAANPDALRRPPGQINMARLAPEGVQPAPALPVAVQRATGLGSVQAGAVPPPPNASAARGQRSTIAGVQGQAVPPAPNVGGLSGSGRKGQIIALSLHPAEVRGPITVPVGNRDGEFAAGPTGKPGATGSPGSSETMGTDGSGGHKGSPGPGPEGIYIGPAPPGTPTSPVAGPSAARPAPVEMAKVLSSTMRPSLADIARQAATVPLPPAPSASSDDVMAKRVFAGKRYYSLTLNMPNLTSVTGSWIIRFAELRDRHDGIAVAAPVAMNKVDPAYPQELVRTRVEGTVALYAVIHSDGSVGEIRVLRSVDRLLDASAVRALAGWRFHPGTKNGTAVDLEAVIEIPFHATRLSP